MHTSTGPQQIRRLSTLFLQTLNRRCFHLYGSMNQETHWVRTLRTPRRNFFRITHYQWIPELLRGHYVGHILISSIRAGPNSPFVRSKAGNPGRKALFFSFFCYGYPCSVHFCYSLGRKDVGRQTTSELCNLGQDSQAQRFPVRLRLMFNIFATVELRTNGHLELQT